MHIELTSALLAPQLRHQPQWFKVAPEDKPNNEIDTATANSKKFDAPIMPHGAAIEYGNVIL